MVTLLLITLVIFDLILLGAVYFVHSRRLDDMAVIKELTEERRMLQDLRGSVQEELQIAGQRNRDILARVTQIATEAEHEVKVGTDTLRKELETIVAQLSGRFEAPLMELSKKQAALENLARKVDREKKVLLKNLERGEKICRFFDQKIPYEEVLADIEDKKYENARQMLAQGYKPEQIASEIGISASEIKLIAGFIEP